MGVPLRVYLRTLGALELQGATYPRPKSLLLLSYLAVEGGRDRRHLSELFFGQARDALGSLRITLSRLRTSVPGAFEEGEEGLKATLECDARALLKHLDAGELELGVQAYSGAFLPGLRVPDWGVELEEWVYATREYLAGRVRAALLTLGERRAGQGDFLSGAALAERALTLAGAPEPEVEQIRRMDALLSAADSPHLALLRQRAQSAGVTLLGSGAEARRALGRTPAFSANVGPRGLPTRATSFVGRRVEQAEVLRALDRPEVRLLTLVGPGGIGKTRLALEVARRASHRGAAAFVSLEAAASVLTLPDSFACALGLTLAANVPPLEALIDVLKDTRLLLVLDSVEHLLKGVPYLSRLLQACPGVTVLVTSRERLGLQEEFLLTLGGLTVPASGEGLDDARRAEAVELFVRRAQRARLDFDLSLENLAAVREVCLLVGGSPLGVELAAAWVRMMPVEDIAEEVRRTLDVLQTSDEDVSTRHHSVRAVFEQTWERLTAEERSVMVHLSVFRGGFTREAAGAVSGATLPALANLVDKSLVRVAEHGRYDLHVLLQQFIREVLARDPQEQARAEAAHRACMLRFVEEAGNAIRRLHDEKRWQDRINRDIENVRSALEGWLADGQVREALRCVEALRNFWPRTGRMREARRWLRRVLDAEAVPPQILRLSLALDGEMAFYLHQYDEARQQLEAAVAIAEQLGLPSALQWLHLGSTAQRVGNMEAAQRHFERALTEFQNQGNVGGVAAALNNLGVVLTAAGAYPNALLRFEEALAAKRALGGDVDSVLMYLGQLFVRMGRYDDARDHFFQALRGLMERGFHHYVPDVLEGLGTVASAQERPHEAGVLWGAAQRQREDLDVQRSLEERERFEQLISPVRMQLGVAAFEAAWTEGHAWNAQRLTAYAQRPHHIQ